MSEETQALAIFALFVWSVAMFVLGGTVAIWLRKMGEKDAEL